MGKVWSGLVEALRSCRELIARIMRPRDYWKAKLEEESNRYGRVLRENTDRYRAIVETAVDAIIVADRFGTVLSFNRAAEKIFGYEAREIVGQNVRMLMPEPDRSRHDSYLAAYRETAKAKIIGIGREVTGRRKDGTNLSLDLAIAEWRDSAGEECFTGMMRDVTSRNQQARELQQATEAAEQARIEAEAANIAKTEFLARMSHEIRTPLMSISGYADLLMRTGTLSKEHGRYVDLIRSANAALLTIVNDVLDFSRVEAGQIELQSGAFSLTRLIHDTIAIMRPIAAAKPIVLRSSLDRNLPEWLKGDDARLRQVLLNLLSNAIKFTEKGSVTVAIRPILSREGEELIHFSVNDTGIGISPEHQHRLFKQFSQADGSISRRFGGTGLGLAICKRLVDLMGGDIGVTSEAGAGTTIWFTARLPATAQPSTPDQTTEPTEVFAINRAKILLVDDLETNREIVSAYLKDGGFNVVPVGSGAEAIERLRGEKFDLILMDIQMPDMDGITATGAIREMRAPVRDIPILAMTGNVLPQQIQTFLKAGMNDHVGKPIVRTKLYSTLWRWLPHETANDQPAPATSPLFNPNKFEELIANLGPAKVERTLRLFEKQLLDCFRSDLATSRREAHDLINGAGVLGFESLLARAYALKEAVADDEEARRLLAQCCNTRDAVIDIIAETIRPQLGGSGYRRSA